MGADLSGKLIDGRYQVVDRIADGAMGVVYRANRLKLDRPVAIKVMHASLPDEMKARERFEREAQLMARLEHPHCVSIIDYGFYGAKPYVVMELVRGHSLADMLAEQGRIDVVRAAEIMTQVLSGLAHAHEQGIIHRDVKPANIMVTPKAPLGVHARILDFGLARMLGQSASLSDGIAVGTPSYMSPEQCRGDELDTRVDVYACGVVLFEMLTGKKPFVAAEPIDIVKLHLQQPAPRLADVTPGDYGALEDVVARALAKAPEDRYPSATAMAEAIAAAVGTRRPTSVTDTTAQLGADATRRLREPSMTSSALRRTLPVSRARWYALAIVLVLAAGGAAAYVLVHEPEPAPVVTTPPVIDAAIVAIDAAPDPVDAIVADAEQLAASGKVDAAITRLVDARKVYPDRASLPALAGKLYFRKLWWSDGIASFRAALALDPSLREDREILQAALRSFLTTPSYDHRLAALVLELAPSITPLVDEAATSHPNKEKRARAAALRKRIR